MNFNEMKIAFFDIDGTLYSHNHKQVSDKVVQALNQLQANGIKICVATGRPKGFFDLLKDEFKNINFDFYITNNGQAIYDKDDNIIYKNYLNPKDVSNIISKANELDLCISVLGDNYSYLSKENELVKQSFEYINSTAPQIKKLDADFDKPVENLVCYESIDYMETFKRVIKHSVITYWSDYTFDFVPDNGVKVNGIKMILDHLKINQEDTMAFGDGQNDIDMLEFVGFGVAMKNSSLIVQEAADYVCEHVDDDGVYHTLKKIKLI